MIKEQAFASHEPGSRGNLSGHFNPGMLLVDYFASNALGYVLDNNLSIKNNENQFSGAARLSYEYAIAMMKERERLKQSGVI